MPKSKTIPIFNIDYDIDKTIEFYKKIGFEVTFYQKSPYKFASLKNNILELFLFGKKDFNFLENISSCYVVVSNIEKHYDEIKSNMKTNYKKILRSGMPKISTLNQTSEDIRFSITDPSGNYIIVGQPIKKINKNHSKNEIEKMYDLAYTFAYSKEDIEGSLKMIDSLLNNSSKKINNDFLLYKIYVLKIDLLFLLGHDVKTINKFINKVSKLKKEKLKNINTKKMDERINEIINELNK